MRISDLYPVTTDLFLSVSLRFVEHRPHHVQRLRLQMQNIVHSIQSSFVSCACGSTAKDCALRLMENFVDGEFPLRVPPPVSSSQHYSRGKSAPRSPVARRSTVSPEMDLTTESPLNKHPASLSALKVQQRNSRAARRAEGGGVDLGPLIGAQRGIRTRVIGGEASGGMRGVEMVDEQGRVVDDGFGAEDRRTPGIGNGKGKEKEKESAPEVRIQQPTPRKLDRKAKSRATFMDLLQPSPNDDTERALTPSKRPRVNGLSTHEGVAVAEDKMPPKMRKKWIRQSSDNLKGAMARENEARALSPLNMLTGDVGEDRSRSATPREGRRTSVGSTAGGVGLGLRFDKGFAGEDQDRMDVDQGAFLSTSFLICAYLTSHQRRRGAYAPAARSSFRIARASEKIAASADRHADDVLTHSGVLKLCLGIGLRNGDEHEQQRVGTAADETVDEPAVVRLQLAEREVGVADPGFEASAAGHGTARPCARTPSGAPIVCEDVHTLVTVADSAAVAVCAAT